MAEVIYGAGLVNGNSEGSDHMNRQEVPSSLSSLVCASFFHALYQGIAGALILLALSRAVSGADDSRLIERGFDDPISPKMVTPGNALLEVELPVIQAGEKVEVRLSVVNKSDDDWKILSGATSCGCSSASIVESEWPAGGLNEIRVQLDTKRMERQTQVQLRLVFKGLTSSVNHSKLQMIVNLHAKHSNILGFLNSVLSEEIDSEAEFQVRIPIHCTTERDSIDVRCSDHTVLSDFDIEDIDNKTYLVGRGDATSIDWSIASCVLTLINTKTKSESEIALYLRRPAKVALSPSVLRFRKNMNTSKWVSDAVLRVGEGSVKQVILDARLVEGQMVLTNLKPVTDRTARLELVILPEKLEEAVENVRDSKRKLKIQVRSKSLNHVVIKDVLFLEPEKIED